MLLAPLLTSTALLLLAAAVIAGAAAGHSLLSPRVPLSFAAVGALLLVGPGLAADAPATANDLPAEVAAPTATGAEAAPDAASPRQLGMAAARSRAGTPACATKTTETDEPPAHGYVEPDGSTSGVVTSEENTGTLHPYVRCRPE
jgi:hypothetical protein